MIALNYHQLIVLNIYARRLVTFFSKSLLAAQALEDHQKHLGKDVKRLIGDVSFTN